MHADKTLLALVCATGLMAQSLWKEFTLASVSQAPAPWNKTVEWTFAPVGAKVAVASCCPWLESEAPFGRVGNDPWSMRVTGVWLKSLVAWMEGVPQVRLVAPDWMSNQRYSLTAQVSGDYRLRLRRREESENSPGAEVRTLIRRELEDRLQLKVHRETRVVPVYVVKAGPNAKLGAGTPEGLQAWARDGMFRAVNVTEAAILNWLQNELNRPVFGADFPAGGYEVQVKWTPGNTRSLTTALHEQIGLDLFEDHRELEFLIVDYALKPEWR
jgi:uncharacterized protein (TIGR03435 family)